MYLLNSSQIQNRIGQSRMINYQIQSNRTPSEITTALYLGILSRFPTGEELQIAGNYFQSANKSKREATVDLAWALMNSDEFLYRH